MVVRRIREKEEKTAAAAKAGEDAAMHAKEEKVERLVQATLRRFGLAPPPPPLSDDPQRSAGGNGPPPATTLWGVLQAALRVPPPPLAGFSAAVVTAGARPKPPSSRGLLFAFACVMTQLGAPPGPILAALRTARLDIELAASVFGHLTEAVVLEDVER